MHSWVTMNAPWVVPMMALETATVVPAAARMVPPGPDPHRGRGRPRKFNRLAESPRRRLRPARRRDRRPGVLRRARPAGDTTSFEDASSRTRSWPWARANATRHASPAARGRRGTGRASRKGDGRRRLGRRLETAPLRCRRRRAPDGRAPIVAPSAPSATRPSTAGAGAAGREPIVFG